MKYKFFVLGMFMILSCVLFAQKEKVAQKSIGITFSSIGSNDVINSAGQTLTGSPSYNGKSFYTVGITCIYPFRSWIAMESGIEYSKHAIVVKPMSLPNEDSSPYERKISMISIPVTARINFLKYCFINGGVMFDIETGTSSPIDKQDGLGALFGIGVGHSLNNGLGIFINGYYKFHSLVPFSTDNDEYRWRLTEGGLRMGLTYSF